MCDVLIVYAGLSICMLCVLLIVVVCGCVCIALCVMIVLVEWELYVCVGCHICGCVGIWGFILGYACALYIVIVCCIYV